MIIHKWNVANIHVFISIFIARINYVLENIVFIFDLFQINYHLRYMVYEWAIKNMDIYFFINHSTMLLKIRCVLRVWIYRYSRFEPIWANHTCLRLATTWTAKAIGPSNFANESVEKPGAGVLIPTGRGLVFRGYAGRFNTYPVAGHFSLVFFCLLRRNPLIVDC